MLDTLLATPSAWMVSSCFLLCVHLLVGILLDFGSWLRVLVTASAHGHSTSWQGHAYLLKAKTKMEAKAGFQWSLSMGPQL